MADEPTKTPGSITQPADNSEQRISEISNINRTISSMQKQIDQQLTEIDKDVGTSEAIAEVQSSMTKVLNKMSSTVGQIGTGFSRVASDTAKSGRDMISEYSKAIQQDINYNKQNMVAMALSRTSPIFGYYVSKFVETDVWKSATDRMKANIGNALGSVGQKFKSALSGISFRKKSSTIEESATKGKRSVKESKSSQGSTVKGKKTSEKVPQMQRGGVVEKGGLARLHAAEVVMPVEKLLSRIDDQMDVTKTLAKTVEKGQMRSIAKLSTYVGDADGRQEKSTFKAFLKAMHQVQSQYEEPAEQRMLRALLAIQDALGAQIGTWQQVFQKMVITNPVFRNAMITGKILKQTLGAPFKPAYAFFAGRGGYEGHLSSSQQPLQAVAENVGILYTGSMHRLDRITTYTMATAEAVRDLSSYITGKTYKEIEGIKTGRWSFFGGARGLINFVTKWGVKGAGWGAGLGKSKEQKLAIKQEADTLADRLTRSRDPFWKRWTKNTFGGQQERLSGGLAGTGEGESTPERALIQVFSNRKLLNWVKSRGALPVIDTSAQKMLELQEDSYKLESKEARRNKKLLQITDENWRENKQMNAREKRKTIFGFLSGGFGAVKNILGSVMGFLPMIMGLFGFGSLGGAGGGIGGFIKDLFLGKGGKGGIAKKLATTISGALTSFLGSGALATVLGAALAVAVGGVLGWNIGKKLDSALGITEKFKEKMEKWDQDYKKLSAEVSATRTENLKKSREGDFKSRLALGVQNTMLGGDTFNKSAGFWGQQHLAAIQEAQRKTMNKNIEEYLQYSPETIRKMREKWIKSGKFYGTKGIGTNAEFYGRRREEEFLKYLKANAKPMTEEEYGARFKDYKSKFGLVDQVKAFGLKEAAGTAKDMAAGAYIKSKDMAKNKVTEMIITADALKNQLTDASKKYIDGMKDATKDLGGAINNQTVVISNQLQNAHSSSINGGQGQAGSGIDDYTLFSSRGEVDGD